MLVCGCLDRGRSQGQPLPPFWWKSGPPDRTSSIRDGFSCNNSFRVLGAKHDPASSCRLRLSEMPACGLPLRNASHKHESGINTKSLKPDPDAFCTSYLLLCNHGRTTLSAPDLLGLATRAANGCQRLNSDDLCVYATDSTFTGLQFGTVRSPDHFPGHNRNTEHAAAQETRCFLLLSNDHCEFQCTVLYANNPYFLRDWTATSLRCVHGAR